MNRTGPEGVKTNPDMDGLAKFGTAVVVMFNNMIGTLPTRNYTEGQFELAEPISGEKMAETILKRRETCYACVVRCKRVVEIEEGKYKFDPIYGGPEYETIGLFGSSCGIGDLAVGRPGSPDLRYARSRFDHLRSDHRLCHGML